MKTAFKILPVTTQPLHFLAEIGEEGLSIIYYSIAPFRVEGWINFHFDKNQPASGMAAALNKLLENEVLPTYNSCHIFFNFKQSMLVPVEFYKESEAAAMLECLYGAQPTDAVFSEPVNVLDAINVYRVDDQLYNLLNNKFPSAVFYHTHTLFIPYLVRLNKELFCTVYQDSIRVVLNKENKLQLVQYFDYNTPSDVAYHLLNVCARHSVSPAEVNLALSGFIEKDSNLYEELYRYFLNIELEKVTDDIQVSGEVGQTPPHFFSHLIALAECVS